MLPFAPMVASATVASAPMVQTLPLRNLSSACCVVNSQMTAFDCAKDDFADGPNDAAYCAELSSACHEFVRRGDRGNLTSSKKTRSTRGSGLVRSKCSLPSRAAEPCLNESPVVKASRRQAHV